MLILLIVGTVRLTFISPRMEVKITYISLDHRIDRQALLEAELDHMGVSYTRTAAVRGNASMLHVPIRDKRRRQKQIAGIGCTLSHIKALDNSRSNVLVLEDDVTFRYLPNLRRLLLKDWWDVIAFAFNGAFDPRECWVVHGTRYCRSRGFKTSSAYLVRDNYREAIIGILRTGRDRLARGTKYESAALDVVWQELAQKDRWFVSVPRIARQRPSYSDIETKNVDYGL